MTKKEFTDRRPKEYNEKSDVELIELLDTGTLMDWQRDSIKALLDKRTKIAIHDLTSIIKRNNEVTDKYNNKLVLLTRAITILTFFLVVGLVIQIYLSLSTQ